MWYTKIGKSEDRPVTVDLPDAQEFQISVSHTNVLPDTKLL